MRRQGSDTEQQGARARGVDRIEACEALAEEVDRVAALLRSVRDPGAAAVGEWSLAEVATHLTQAWTVVPGLARGDVSEIRELLDTGSAEPGPLIADIWDLAGLTTEAVRAEPVRDPRVLADRLEQRARAFLARIGPASAEGDHQWLVEGVRVPTTTLVCHLLNETIVHGYDLARADGRGWPVSRRHAALVIDGFLVPILRRLPATTMVDQEAAAGLEATYRIQVRDGQDHLFVFRDGGLVVVEPDGRRVDCHVSADPVAFLLLAWDRRSQWPAILTGQLLAWGRRPWLGPRLNSLMRSV